MLVLRRNDIPPYFLPSAFQSMATMLIAAGVERSLAVMASSWFRKHWTMGKTWILVASAYGYAMIPAAVGLNAAWNAVPKSVTLTRGVPNVFGYGIVNWNFGATVLGGTLAVILTISGYRYGMNRIRKLPYLSGERGRLRRQLRLTRSMLTVACLDFCLVVVSTLVAFLGNATKALPTAIHLVYEYILLS
jgi:hypothetical protein